MSQLTGPCQSTPWPLPSARDIARLETELRLDAIIQSVGVIDNRSLNRSARVRVRSVACRHLPNGDAMCAYEANPCPDNEQITAPDNWCARETRFIHFGGLPTVEGHRSEGWAISRSRAEGD